MKTTSNILKLIYIVIILSAGVGIFLKETIICPVIIMVLTIACFFVLSKMQNVYKGHIFELEKEIEESDELRRRYRLALEQEQNARKLAECKKTATNDAPHILLEFKRNVSTPYMDMLSSFEMPLSETDKQKVIDSTVEVAMLAVDMADAHNWSLENRVEQKINLELIAGTIDKKQALDRAIMTTENPKVTPRWARALYQALNEKVSINSGIIYSGYKFKENYE